MIGLYLLQARTLFKLERLNDAKVLAELIAAILKDQGWKDKNEYNRLFKYYKIEREEVDSTKEVIKRAREFFGILNDMGIRKKERLYNFNSSQR